jgi:hypothetical protein
MRCLALKFIPSTRMVFAFLAYCIFYINPAGISNSSQFITPHGTDAKIIINYLVG